MSVTIPWSKSLNARLGLIVALIALLMAGVAAMNIAIFVSLKSDAEKMNLFGLGRTYVVELRYLVDYLLDADADKQAAARVRLREVATLKDEWFDKLYKGDPSKDMAAVTEPTVLAALEESG